MARPRTKRLEEVNARCGRLVVLAFDKGRYYCVCDCGTRKWIQAANVERGVTKSCGCLRKDFCGRPKFPPLTEQDKKFIDRWWVPSHPVFGYLGLAKILNKEPHTIEYYIRKKGRQPKHVVNERTVHVWQPIRGCAYNPMLCMLRNKQPLPHPLQLKLEYRSSTRLNAGETLENKPSATLTLKLNQNAVHERLEAGNSTIKRP